MVSERALALQKKAFVVDTHCDTILKVLMSENPFLRRRYQLEQPIQLGNRNPALHLDFAGMREGGVNLQFFAVYIEPEYKPCGSLRRTLQGIDAFYRQLEQNPEVVFVKSYADVERAQEKDSLAALLSIEGGEALEGDLGVLRMLYQLGVRCIGLTWNQRNRIAEGVGDCESGGGLTAFGKQVVREMNKLGMIIDVSHISEPGFWDVIEVSEQPIIASHSNAKAVCNHVRNLTDDQIKALAENGGVMGMNYCRSFVGEGETVTVATLVNHIEHIIDLVGPDHVGLGSDFDGIGATPDGLTDVTKVPLITEELVRRGYSDQVITKILGGNYLRVLQTVLGR